MSVRLKEVIEVLERIAPASLAEEWDNVGLQLGDPQAPVRSAWVALDPTPEVVEAATRAGVDLLITHHPLFFRPLRRVDLGTPLGALVDLALRSGLSVVAVHTNFDAVAEGLNDLLAGRLGLRGTRPLIPSPGAAGAGRHGIGRVGSLPRAASLAALAREVKQRLGLEALRIAGDPALDVRRVAVSTGSGGSVIPHFFDSGAQVFISGDLRYHEARDVEAAKLGLIDVGHFHSEHLMKDVLVERLRKAFTRRRKALRVTACPLEKDPFVFL
jgi:dinuclear metal center YbgI/SA1388 family protein